MSEVYPCYREHPVGWFVGWGIVSGLWVGAIVSLILLDCMGG